MNYRNLPILVAIAGFGASACSDEPRPCGWLAPTPEAVTSDAFDYSCDQMTRPVEVVAAYTCLDCVNSGRDEGIEVRFEVFDAASAEGTYLGAIMAVIPKEPLSGEVTLADDAFDLSGEGTIDSVRLSWSRDGDMPYVDLSEDELEEGVTYASAIDVSLDYTGTLPAPSSGCENGTFEVTGYETTIEASSEVSFCEPLQLEDLGDIRIGH